jgi:hypothetical protein
MLPVLAGSAELSKEIFVLIRRPDGVKQLDRRLANRCDYHCHWKRLVHSLLWSKLNHLARARQMEEELKGVWAEITDRRGEWRACQACYEEARIWL